jgi:hypothetical protein
MTDISVIPIIINAADDSVKTFIRPHIISFDSTTKIQETKSIGCNISRSTVVEIPKYFPQADTSKVKFHIKDKNDSNIERIKEKELRSNKQLGYSKIELEFFKNGT